MAETENHVPESTQGERPRLETMSVESKPGEGAGQPAEPRLPRAEYEVITSKRDEPETTFMSEHYHPVAVDGATDGKTAEGEAAVPQARLSKTTIERIGKSESSQTRKYAAIGIGLGLLVGLAIAVFFLRPGTQGGPNDIGDVTSTAFGLKGHLSTEWKNERLSYRLTMEPATPAQRAGFIADVNSSPRPLSITLQAKDPFGAVLCSDTILVKFDPRNVPVGGQEGQQLKSSDSGQSATRNEIARGLNLARLEGQELDREHGKTLFQSDIGADGQLASISAQGVLPCKKNQVERFASWGFTSDFPILVKPEASGNAAGGSNADAGSADATDEKAKREAAAAAKAKRKAPALPPIYIEGDDSIVWFDPAGGVLETRAGMTMLVDKTDTVASALKGHELPIPIHYRCDQSGGCTFSVMGLGLHHSRLRR